MGDDGRSEDKSGVCAFLCWEAFLAVTLGTVLLSSSLTQVPGVRWRRCFWLLTAVLCAQAFGLSETLGAFVGGVLVAETDYKHQIEARGPSVAAIV